MIGVSWFAYQEWRGWKKLMVWSSVDSEMLWWERVSIGESIQTNRAVSSMLDAYLNGKVNT